jgi:hypothetical protein
MCFKSSKLAPSGPNAHPRLRPACRGLMGVVSLLWRHLATTHRPPPGRTPVVVPKTQQKARCKGILRTSRKRRNRVCGGTAHPAPPTRAGATPRFPFAQCKSLCLSLVFQMSTGAVQRLQRAERFHTTVSRKPVPWEHGYNNWLGGRGSE